MHDHARLALPGEPCTGYQKRMDSPRTPRTPRLDARWEATEDYRVSPDGKTITKQVFGYEQGAVASQVLEQGVLTWTFTIEKSAYEDSHMFLGVSDVEDEMAWAFSPSTGSLYFHADKDRWGKEMKTRIMSGNALFGCMEGSKVQVIVDMAAHTLSFQIHAAGKAAPEDIFELSTKDCLLPEQARAGVGGSVQGGV